MNNKNKRHFLAKVLSLVLCTTVAVSIMPGFNSFAKTSQESSADQIALLEIAANAAAVDKAYDAVMKARSSKKTLDKDYALSLITALSPTNKVRLYVKLSKDYYFKNYRIPGFKYFDAEKYLLENPDVRLAGLNSKVVDLYEYALRHYLEYGIYDARESETSFDPIVAILATPESFEQVITNDNSTPDAVYNNYVKITGKQNTSDQKVIWTAPKGTEKYKDEPLVHELNIVPDKKPVEKPKEIVSNDPEIIEYDEYEDDDDYDAEDDEEEEDDPPAPSWEPHFLNKHSVKLTPYQLYSTNQAESFSFVTDTYTYPAAKNTGKTVTVNFNSTNYNTAKKLAEGKKYTFMIYMCGTDQETDESFRRATAQIASMLQAENLDNVNVLLYLGGTESYGSSYVNEKVSNLRNGIFYVNPSGLSDEVRDKLKKIDFSSENFDNLTRITEILEGKRKDEKGIAYGLNYNDIINSDSLIELSTTSTPADMTDPGMLSGFINFATDLFPADDYGLSLSNHGGGFGSGIILSPSYEHEGTTLLDENMIKLYMLESALAATNLSKSRTDEKNGRLGFILYDACNMSTAEQAYNTMDYVKYSIASEEQTMNQTEYRTILNALEKDVKNNSSDKDIAIDITKEYAGSKWHRGHNSGLMGSVAVLSSDAMKSMYQEINSLSKSMTDVLDGSDNTEVFQKDLFLALRKATYSSYMSYGNKGTFHKQMEDVEAVDIGDFYNSLNRYMNQIAVNSAKYNDKDRNSYALIKERLAKVLESGFVVYLTTQAFEGFGEISGQNGNSVIPLNYSFESDGDIWTDPKTGAKPKDGEKDQRVKNYPYAASIFMPLMFDNSEFLESGIYSYYKDTELNDYVNFIENYVKYYNDSEKGGYDYNKKELKKEMNDQNLYAKLVSQEYGNDGGYSTVVDSNGKKVSYLSFIIPDTYEEVNLEKPEHSTGSPMLDIIETSPSIQIAAVHKEYFKADDADGNNYNLGVDMICAEKELSPYNVSLGGNTIYFDVTDMTKSIITGWSLNGYQYNADTKKRGESEEWQFVLKSSLESNKDDKQAAMEALYGADNLPDAKDIITVTGSVRTNDPKNDNYINVYHFFKKSENDNKLDYSGTVRYQQEEGTNKNIYSKIDDTYAISSYHYVLRKQTDEDGNVISTFKDVLENHDGIGDGYFYVPSPDENIRLFLESVQITENIAQEGEEDDFTNEKTGYMIDPLGQGNNYSQIAYINEDMYLDGNNCGNGLLQVIDVDAAEKVKDDYGNFIQQIGVFVEEEKEEDDYEPQYDDDEDDDYRTNKEQNVSAEENQETVITDKDTNTETKEVSEVSETEKAKENVDTVKNEAEENVDAVNDEEKVVKSTDNEEKEPLEVSVQKTENLKASGESSRTDLSATEESAESDLSATEESAGSDLIQPEESVKSDLAEATESEESNLSESEESDESKESGEPEESTSDSDAANEETVNQDDSEENVPEETKSVEEVATEPQEVNELTES